MYSTALAWHCWFENAEMVVACTLFCQMICLQPERQRMHVQTMPQELHLPAFIIILMELRLTTMALSLINMAVGYGVGICRQDAWRLGNP